MGGTVPIRIYKTAKISKSAPLKSKIQNGMRIRRRRFGQIAIVSAATAALSNFATKTEAQQQSAIYGVRLSTGSSGINAVTDTASTSAANNTPGIVLTSIDLSTGQELLTAEVSAASVENQQADSSQNQAIFTRQPQVDRITGLTSLSDGSFITATVANTRRGKISRLVITNPNAPQSRRGLRVTNLPRNSTVESLLATTDNNLFSVLSLNQGVLPFRLATLDRNSGRVGSRDDFPDLIPIRRFSNLAQSPTNGTIYLTTLGSEGSTTLVQLDLQQRSLITGKGRIIRVAALRYNNEFLENDVLSLAVSPSGQLFALADPNYEGTNSLFTVDVSTGNMTLVRRFAVDKIAFRRG